MLHLANPQMFGYNIYEHTTTYKLMTSLRYSYNLVYSYTPIIQAYFIILRTLIFLRVIVIANAGNNKRGTRERANRITLRVPVIAPVLF
jgi:type II secretory pathway component PulF